MVPGRLLCDHRASVSQGFSMSLQKDTSNPEKKFRGWRLVGFILCVVVVLALVSAVVDWMVIGPLEGRAF